MLNIFSTRSAVGALLLGLFAPAALAGGYGGSSKPASPITPQQAEAYLAYADYYRDGNFSVRHTEAAGAQAATAADGESASGYGSSETDIEGPGGTKSWKRSVQRSGSRASNGSASATGFTATILKIRTADGRYYMFKGLASTGASAGPGGTSATRYGMAKSAGGRVNR
jgi:hypothetical protein